MELYINKERIKELIEQLHTVSYLKRVGYEGVEDAELEVYINKANKYIDNFKFRGIKYNIKQELQFPRVVDGVLVAKDCMAISCAIAVRVVEEIRLNNDIRFKAIEDGVTSISTLAIKETYDKEKRVDVCLKYLANYLL